MKIGVSSYCYSSLIGKDGFTLFDAIRHAGEAGFDEIEFTDFEAPEGDSMIGYAQKLREACEASNLQVVNFAVGSDFIDGSGGDPAKETARVKGLVDVAHALGARFMRHDTSWNPKDRVACRTYRDVIRKIVPYIREVADYAEAKGIRTMSENHGYLMQDSCRMEELVIAVGHPNYGLLVDIGNFMCADEASLDALPTAMPYAFHVHAKDFLWKDGAQERPDDSWFPTRQGHHLRGTVLGHGVVSVAQCLRFVKASGYGGTVSLEFEGLESPINAIERGLAFLRKCLCD
jgi:sugar phosphate isomerase/epimerase